MARRHGAHLERIPRRQARLRSHGLRLPQRARAERVAAMTDLAQHLTQCRKLLATDAPNSEKIEIFRDAAFEIGRLIGNGIEKGDAVDSLIDTALAHDFFAM